LTYRLDTTANEDILNQLNSKNKELRKHNEELRIEVKACEKIQNNQGKELLKVNEETDFYYKIKSLSEDLRMQKQRNKD
jgi:hypothetical protein